MEDIDTRKEDQESSTDVTATGLTLYTMKYLRQGKSADSRQISQKLLFLVTFSGKTPDSLVQPPIPGVWDSRLGIALHTIKKIAPMKSTKNVDSTLAGAGDLLQDDYALSDHVLIAIRRIIRAIDLQSRLLLDRYGLTGPQLVVLRALIEQREISVGELARHVHLSQATATGVLDRLEKRGLVTRQRSKLDRRRTLVRATPQAEALLQQKPTLLQEQFLRQFEHLQDWEQTQILSSLQRIVAMMEAESIDATPMLTTGPIDQPG